MLNKVSLVNSNLQSIDFLQRERKERKVCYFKKLFYKAIKARTTLESPTEKVYIIGEVEIIK